MRHCSSFSVVELMRNGLRPRDAGVEVMQRVLDHIREPWLQTPEGSPNFGLKFYVLNQHGDYAGISLWGPSQFAVTDQHGTRFEECAYLLSKP